MEHIARPPTAASLIRELFRNTVTVADEDPPGMEFRILRQLAWQTEPDTIYTLDSKPLALVELKHVRAYHEYYTDARVWLEYRQVAPWREVE